MIETKRLIIREIQDKDYEELLKVYRKPENMRYILTGKYDWTKKELIAKWNFSKYNEKDKTGFKIVFHKNSGDLIGECGLLQTKKKKEEELELAYLIDQNYWGLGLGTEICQHLICQGFEVLKVKALIAGMYKENKASSKIVKKLGLKLVKEQKLKSGIEIEEYEIKLENYTPSRIIK